MWITTWNVNGIRARKDRVLSWVDQYYPPILCLQETRCLNAVFPHTELSSYYEHIAHTDQPKSNGVAILSKHKLYDIDINPIGDDQHRVIAATIKDHRIINIYVPQGSAIEDPKYSYKLNWWASFSEWYKVQGLKYGTENTVIVGDYNICPTERDVWSTKHWHEGIVSCTPVERAMFRAFKEENGLIDAIDSLTSDQVFTWFGYREWKWNFNNPLKFGVRIDHVLHTSDLKALEFHVDFEERCKSVGASDHLPVSVKLVKS